MAKKPKDGSALVIVESPTKAKTISRFLGANYTVEASKGHVRDLAKGKGELPDKYKTEDWAEYCINVHDGFAPVYIVPSEKKSHVTKLRQMLRECSALYLATDEDREGEAIAWHLLEILKPKVPVHRLVFHEITEEAIQASLEHPRDIDDALVRAQEARRILDRLYGWVVSKFVWEKVRYGLSAGRVQSVALRKVVQRERERRAFVSATYWDLLGTFAGQESASFQATLNSVDGKRIPRGSDFDSKTGKLKNDGFMLLDEAGATALADRLKTAEFRVKALDKKPFTRRPAAPFTTSTLIRDANRKLNMTSAHAMRVAQSLYENGHITYMRTDSTSLAKVAVDAARDLVQSEYGNEFLPAEPRIYSSKVKNAQEAHEAIRPAGHPFQLPEALKGQLARDEFRLFELIWKRTIASQMENARGYTTTITLEGDGAVFQVSGKTIEFPGFLRAYVEGSDDPAAELADEDRLLPPLTVEQLVNCLELEGKGHTTQPPARYTEATLTKTLEDEGIGRPSTYASIIELLVSERRRYVFRRGTALVPTWTAFSVVKLLEDHLTDLVDYHFTAQMEEFLDAISRRETGHVEYLNDFFFGNGKPGLQKRVKTKREEVEKGDVNQFPLGHPETGELVVLNIGARGPYIQQGERKANIPEELPPDELTLAKAVELLDQREKEEEPLGVCPDTHKPVFLRHGRFGPYVQLGIAEEGEEKPKTGSLLPKMAPAEVDFAMALKLLTLPRDLGPHPESNEPVQAHNGRYGPYIMCGKETRSLPADVSPLDVTLERALALLAQPKQRGRGAPREPLKVLKPSPVTEQPIQLLEGRFGPYVTDGETNASLPRSMALDDVTFEEALRLLAERAAKGPAKKKKKKKKAAKKKAAKKKKAKKKAAKKKAKKKAAKKTEAADNENAGPALDGNDQS